MFPNVTISFIVGASATTTTTASIFGPGSGPVFVADVHCTGSEETLLQCSHSKISLGSYCNHNRDVGVRCEGICTCVTLAMDAVKYFIPSRNSRRFCQN